MKHLIFMDSEVSDLPEFGGELIEIALLQVTYPEFVLVNRVHTRIKPSKPLRPEIIEVTGISNEDLAQAPFFEGVAEQVSALLLSGKVLTKSIHFELAILKNTYQTTGCQFAAEAVQFIDMIDIENKLGLTSHDNEFVARTLGLPFDEGCLSACKLNMKILELAFQKGLLDDYV